METARCDQLDAEVHKQQRPAKFDERSRTQTEVSTSAEFKSHQKIARQALTALSALPPAPDRSSATPATAVKLVALRPARPSHGVRRMPAAMVWRCEGSGITAFHFSRWKSNFASTELNRSSHVFASALMLSANT
jgi:hypothetical protein